MSPDTTARRRVVYPDIVVRLAGATFRGIQTVFSPRATFDEISRIFVRLYQSEQKNVDDESILKAGDRCSGEVERLFKAGIHAIRSARPYRRPPVESECE